MKAVHCPTCKKPVEPGEKAFPFCSERCRLVDLGNWLGGGYRIADPRNAGDEAPGPDDVPPPRRRDPDDD